MKKAMFIFNVMISAIFAGSMFTYTIYSLIVAGFHNWHIAFIALCILSIALVKGSVRDLIAELKK